MKPISLFVLSVMFIFSACSGQEKNTFKPADPKASVAAAELFSKMRKLSGKGIMIGHQDDLAYGVGWKSPDGKSDVYKICSDYPAVFGWDLGGIENGSDVNLDSVPFADMARFAVEMHERGGINTFSWHADNPLTGGNTWDIKTPGVVKSILPGGTKHAEYNLWLDKIASFFSGLKDSGGNTVPVIFRPFHEHTGDWFWWGRAHCTTDEYKQLWIYTFKYLTENKNIHNLIFAYSPGGSFKNLDEYSERYPGNEFVDIAGFDIYQDTGQESKVFAAMLSEKLALLDKFAKSNNKLPAITEIGFEQIPDPQWWTSVIYQSVQNFKVSYALFWRNAFNRPNHYYMPYPGQISENDFKKFYELPETLFLNDIKQKSIN